MIGEGWRRWIPSLTTAILAALAAAVMLPRLLSPHFGLLDDGVTVFVARALGQALGEGDPTLVLRLEHGRGRFRPFYWLFEAALYAIWGPSALGFYVVNLLALLVTALCVAGTVAAVTGDRLASRLAGIAYVLAPPVVESYYTLSKPEVPLTLWLGVSLWGWTTARTTAEADPRRSRRRLVLAAASLLLAYFTKETTQTMLLVVAAWLAVSWRTARPAAARVDRWYFAAALAWTALFWIMRVASGTAAVTAGDNSRAYALSAASLVSSALGQLIWYARDFPYLLPLLALLAWPAARTGRLDPGLVRLPVLWILGWTLVMLPWPTIFEYYMLPASLGVAALTGVAARVALAALHAPRGAVRVAAGTLVAAALICLPLSLATAVTNARIQLAVDAANASLVDFLAARMPAGAVVLVDLPDPNEYVPELGLHLTLIKGRAEIGGVAYRGQPLREGLTASLVATPHLLNRPRPGVRVPVPDEATVIGSDAARRRFGPSAGLVHRVSQTVPLLFLHVPRPMCDLLERAEAHPALFCARASDGRVLDRRRLRYGWEVYRLDGR